MKQIFTVIIKNNLLAVAFFLALVTWNTANCFFWSLEFLRILHSMRFPQTPCWWTSQHSTPTPAFMVRIISTDTSCSMTNHQCEKHNNANVSAASASLLISHYSPCNSSCLHYYCSSNHIALQVCRAMSKYQNIAVIACRAICREQIWCARSYYIFFHNPCYLMLLKSHLNFTCEQSLSILHCMCISYMLHMWTCHMYSKWWVSYD